MSTGLKLFTSRYSAGKTIKASGAFPVQISLGIPKWKLPFDLTENDPLLTPTREMLTLPFGEYKARYFEKLTRTGLDRIVTNLRLLTRRTKTEGGLVLLCFEDITKSWCHRRMFAEWWVAQTGEVVEELVPAAPEPVNGELFG